MAFCKGIQSNCDDKGEKCFICPYSDKKNLCSYTGYCAEIGKTCKTCRYYKGKKTSKRKGYK